MECEKSSGKRKANAFQKIQENSRNVVKKKNPDAQTGSSFVECCACGSSVFHAFLQSHLDQCLVETSQKKFQPRLPESKILGVQAVGVGCDVAKREGWREVSVADDAAAAPALPNALAALMQSQRARSKTQRQRFHLAFQGGVWSSAWFNRDVNNAKIKPSQEIPGMQIVWEAEMEVKDPSGHGTVILALSTNVPSNAQDDHFSWSAPDLNSNKAVAADARGRLSPSLLKSTVQKNVRLCRSGPAVRSSLHLMKDNAVEFLRRITIIALEDGILHPAVDFLVWLAAACGKGYRMSRCHVAECLRIAHELAAVHVRDPLPPPGRDEPPSVTFASTDAELPPETATIIKCCLLRACLGGMAGDVQMLRRYASFWSARFRGEIPLHYFGSSKADHQVLHQDWLKWLKQLYRDLPPPPYSSASRLKNAVAPSEPISSYQSTSLDAEGASQASAMCSQVSTSTPPVSCRTEPDIIPSHFSTPPIANHKMPPVSPMRTPRLIFPVTPGASTPTSIPSPLSPFTSSPAVTPPVPLVPTPTHGGPHAIERCHLKDMPGVSPRDTRYTSPLGSAGVAQHHETPDICHGEMSCGDPRAVPGVSQERESSFNQRGAPVLPREGLPSASFEGLTSVCVRGVPGVDLWGMPLRSAEVEKAQWKDGASLGSQLLVSGVEPDEAGGLAESSDGAMAMVEVEAVGPMLFSDVPFSAVDFHCSNVAEDLLKDPTLRAAIAANAPKHGRVTDADLSAHLRSAMWLFRSSINKKAPLGGIDLEAIAEVDERRELQSLWNTVREAVEKYAGRYIKWRFNSNTR